MEKITSFTVNHLDLEPGVYVSRKDAVGGETVTTFDLRLTAPNKEPVMNTAEIHTLEHLGATFLRNHGAFGDKVFDTVIKRTVKFPDASVSAEPILSYASSHPGAEAYRQVARELIYKGGAR